MAESATAAPIQAGVWDIDVAHTTIGFLARHMVVTKVRGLFREFTGSITVGADGSVKAEAEIQVSSVNSNSATRDEHILGADFFNAAEFPTINYVSTSVTLGEGGKFTAVGDLTIKGVTKPVTLTGTFSPAQKSPFTGLPVASFEASVEVEREDWNLGWNVPLEGGGLLVSKKVQLEIDGEATLKGDAAAK